MGDGSGMGGSLPGGRWRMGVVCMGGCWRMVIGMEGIIAIAMLLRCCVIHVPSAVEGCLERWSLPCQVPVAACCSDVARRGVGVWLMSVVR